MPASSPPIGPEGFEALYRRKSDPWGTWTSSFEAHKRRMLIAACGPGGYGRVLELGCGVGANTAELARRALRVDAVDSSAAALSEARRRLDGTPNVRFHRTCLPRGLPRRQYDLIVLAELAYYLDRYALDRLTDRMRTAAAPGSRLVMLHHHVPYGDAALTPASVHARICTRVCAPESHTVHRTARWEVRSIALGCRHGRPTP